MIDHVRTDDVALVLGQEFGRASFAGVDVEVVEPEIDEDFLQLPLAVHRTQQLLFGERLHLATGEAAQLFLVRAVGRRVELREHRLRGLVVDARWMQLLVEPPVEAHRAHAIHVPGPGAECQTVERVGDDCGVVCGGRQLNRYRGEHRNEKSCKAIHG